MQSLTGKVTGNSLTAAEWNQLPSEVQNVITGLGITLSSGDLNQLGKAIASYVANGDFYTDSGAADAYVLGVIGSKQTPTAYTDGFSAVFRAGNTNTGASTVNVAGLGVKSIKTIAGADPAAGGITAGDLVEIRYDLANGWFDFISIVADASTTTKGIVELATNAEVQAGTDTVRAITPSGIASFSKSHTTNGYQFLPGGLVIQWGSGDFNTTNLTFPIAFPNAVLGAATTDNSAVTAIQGVDIGLSTTTQLRVYTDLAATDIAFWVAIGY